MSSVLIPVDTDRAPARAQAELIVELFEPETVTATIFHVFEDNPEGASVSQMASARTVEEILSDAGVTISYDETGGEDPAAAIESAATKHDVDLICLGTPERTPAGKAVFGSVSQKVVLNSEFPVVFAPPAEST